MAPQAADPLAELYAWLPDGIRSTYTSHRSPVGRPEGGDTTGGGGRDAFADAILFQAVDTGPDGRGSASFTLSDDLTAWRVSAAAVTAELQAGEGTLSIPVGLPFFVDLAMAPEYLASDRPTIALRGYGSGLTAGDAVTFDVRSESLGLDLRDLPGEAFVGVGVPLPPLTVGSHTITVTARTGSGAGARTDELTRSIVVVASRLTRTITTYDEPTELAGIEAGADGMTEILDQRCRSRPPPAAPDRAGLGPEHPAGADPGRRPGGGHPGRALRLRHAAHGALRRPALPGRGRRPGRRTPRQQRPRSVGDGRPGRRRPLRRASLTAYFRAVIDDAGETRERRNLALAGLGGIGAGALSEIRSALEDPGLTVRERLWLGLGAAALGDAADRSDRRRSARDELDRVVRRHGPAAGRDRQR